jgi:hypothetical protein
MSDPSWTRHNNGTSGASASYDGNHLLVENEESALFSSLGLEGETGYVRLSMVEEDSTPAAVEAPPPLVNIQRHIKPNHDGVTASNAACANFYSSLRRYGSNSADDGDLIDIYNVCVRTDSTSTALPSGNGNGIIGIASFAQSRASSKTRSYAALFAATNSSAESSAFAIACELTPTNATGGTRAAWAGDTGGKCVALTLAAAVSGSGSVYNDVGLWLLAQANAAYRTGIYFSADSVVDYGIDMVNVTGSQTPIRLANNRPIKARNAADSADVDLISLNTSNQTYLPGPIIVGSGGTAVSKILSAQASLNFGVILANDSADLTATVTGAAVTDTLIATPPSGYGAPLVFNAWISAADTVTVRLANPDTVNSADPGALNWRFTVIKH